MTPTGTRRWQRGGALGVLAVLAWSSAGCFNPFKPTLGSTFGVYVPPPDRTSATGVVKLFQWAYERRDYEVYKTLFTEDFQFYFDPQDSAGNLYRQQPWIRDFELESAKHLFDGGSATEPPASSITLQFNPVLNVQDTGDTLDQATHRKINTSVYLQIQAGETNYTVQGNVDFYVVHYSAAKIPADIKSRVGSNDWFIYGWQDNTLETQTPASPASLAARGAGAPAPLRMAQPLGAAWFPESWGAIKARYR